jgi:hypothetical protein
MRCGELLLTFVDRLLAWDVKALDSTDSLSYGGRKMNDLLWSDLRVWLNGSEWTADAIEDFSGCRLPPPASFTFLRRSKSLIGSLRAWNRSRFCVTDQNSAAVARLPRRDGCNAHPCVCIVNWKSRGSDGVGAVLSDDGDGSGGDLPGSERACFERAAWKDRMLAPSAARFSGLHRG